MADGVGSCRPEAQQLPPTFHRGMTKGRPAVSAKPRRPLSLSAEQVASGLRGFCGVARAWGLSEEEQAKVLGIEGPVAVHELMVSRGANVDEEIVTRLSYVFRIFRSINILLPRPGRADAGMRAPNDAPLLARRRLIR